MSVHKNIINLPLFYKVCWPSVRPSVRLSVRSFPLRLSFLDKVYTLYSKHCIINIPLHKNISNWSSDSPFGCPYVEFARVKVSGQANLKLSWCPIIMNFNQNGHEYIIVKNLSQRWFVSTFICQSIRMPTFRPPSKYFKVFIQLQCTSKWLINIWTKMPFALKMSTTLSTSIIWSL